VSAAIRTVASYLGNTPAVCRASYVDPRVIEASVLDLLGDAGAGVGRRALG
jgi:DNA topoisomerase IB